MNTAPKLSRAQRGVMLLEALIAILIFSVGILAIVALYANAIALSSDAKYRSEAALLADQLLAQMWVGDRTAETMKTNFAGSGGTGGTAYTAWLARVQAALPGAQSNPPNVTVDSSTGTATTGQVTINIFWRPPNEPSSSPAHAYRTTAQIR